MTVDVDQAVLERTPLLITFPPPGEAISANQAIRNHGRVNSALMIPWRDAAYWEWVNHHPGVGPSGRRYPPAIVQATIPFTCTRTRDPHNYVITVKAIVDGLVRAGAWPDDNPDWVTVNEPHLAVSNGGIVTVALRPRHHLEATD